MAGTNKKIFTTENKANTEISELPILVPLV